MKTNSTSPTGYRAFKLLLTLLFISTLFIQGVFAQSMYKLSNSPDNVVKVLGTSNVHDWTMTANGTICEAEFGQFAEGSVPKSLKLFSFSVDAKNLKSEHKSMDGRTYKTIKADAYPKITFKVSSASVTPGQKDKFTIKATGTLTIAGVSKVITLLVNGTVMPDNTITCTGHEKIKLTDFKIDPPSFMLGAMKVGDELTIEYNINLKKLQNTYTQNK